VEAIAMSKKILLSSSVLFALLFFTMPGECFARRPEPLPFEYGTNLEKADHLYEYVTNMWPADEIWPQMLVAMRHIARGEDNAAQASVDELLNNFSQNQYLPVALHEIAKLYGHFKKYGKANELLQHVIDNWPQHEYTMWSLRDVARLNIELGCGDTNDGPYCHAAQAAVDKVLGDFPNQKFIPLVTYEIAEHYRIFKSYQKATQLYQYILNTWPDNWRVVLAQSGLARLYIDTGNETAAQSAVNKLCSDFSNVPEVARGIYLVAYYYDQSGRYEKAKPLYEFVLNNKSADWYAMWSQSRLAIIHIAFGNYDAAEASTDSLIANFQVDERIDEAVYDVADQYNRFGRYASAKQLYQYILDTWPDCEGATWVKIGLAQSNISLGEKNTAESIIDGLVAKLNADFPPDTDLPHMAVDGYYYAGGCYWKLGKYAHSIQCYQRIIDEFPDYEYAWNAQFMVGDNYEALKESGAISKSEADTKIKAAYEELLEKYPSCPAAKPAGVWLNRHK
jgi:tetratricopeptide (TPR) repeat protein